MSLSSVSISFSLVSSLNIIYYLVHFVSESCFIQDRMQWKMIEMGRCNDNLYVLDPTNLFPIPSNVTVVCNNASKIEHGLSHKGGNGSSIW